MLIAEKLGTHVSVGRIELGLLNRIIIDDVLILDQQQKEMLKAARLTAKIEIPALVQGKISISSAQIFGVKALFYKSNAQAAGNYQFVIDSLSSKDTTQRSPLDLRINSFIMRHTDIQFDQWDIAPTPGRLNPAHIKISDVSAHIILKKLANDSLNVKVKRLAFTEQSGLDVRRMSFHLIGNKKRADLHDFIIELPASQLRMDNVYATYEAERVKETVHFYGNISNSIIMPSDLRCFIPSLKNYQHGLSLEGDFMGDANGLRVPRLSLISNSGDLTIKGLGEIRRRSSNLLWNLQLEQLFFSDELTDFISKHLVKLPEEILRIGDISLAGHFSGESMDELTAEASVQTEAGTLNADLNLKDKQHFTGKLKTECFNLGQMLDNNKLGSLTADLNFMGVFSNGKLTALTASGTIPEINYQNHGYNNIDFDGSYAEHQVRGWLTIDDDYLKTRVEADLNATSLQDAVGSICLLNTQIPEKNLHMNYLRIESGFEDAIHFVRLNSDFARAELKGRFDYTTISQSVANIIGAKLPTLPGMPKFSEKPHNNFSINLTLVESDWLQKLTGIPLALHEPVNLFGNLNDANEQMNLTVNLPDFEYGGGSYSDGQLNIHSPNDTLYASISVFKLEDNGNPMELQFNGAAAHNKLRTSVALNNHNSALPINGQINATGHFYLNKNQQPEVQVSIHPSVAHINGEPWNIQTSNVIYSANRLNVNNFKVENGGQFIKIDGVASDRTQDSILVSLNDVKVAYILNLVNFHAVDFSGEVTGRAYLASAFKNPSMHADLSVNHFEFQDGRMGILAANVDWNKQLKQIDIHATANDGLDAMTFINGYVSPERNYIDLNIRSRGTHIDFLQSFTESFLKDVGGQAHGEVNLQGPLSAMQLTGELVVDGQATVKPLGTTYTFRKDTIQLMTDDILLKDFRLYDKHDNVAVANGGIHHRHLTNLTFDLDVHTEKLLGYDFKEFGEDTFYGTVFAAGDVNLEGRPGRVTIDCNVTPLENTVFTYNVSSPDAISKQEFITWRNIGEHSSDPQHVSSPDGGLKDIGTNIYLNLFINATPEATMRLLMDSQTGDYIYLNGSGALRATYYNKGNFQLFGTYLVNHGTYSITIQNIIKKQFTFNPGGTIIFGGDPYNAALQLQAVYPVQSVSLSDLNIGNSFSTNTIRVNCLMNISGQPNQPRVDFDLDMPTVNAEEQQMVRSVINGEQEMNQQVLYLLSIGRFYQQGQNNEQSSQDQTSLAMQSILSGTISSQINNVLSSVINNNNWNFGANISTGTEGWNNAEYEGIFNGRMLNNRLLINGQFGYRDNATQATTSFIGDFDIRYLLNPNGNIALKVYNQTNDRYFTRSSLNTQGVGIILKKDFGHIEELFRKR